MGNWGNNIRKVVPYTPGEQPNQTDMIKLNTNENPYPPAPGVTEVLRNTDTDALRLYPDPAAKDLVHAIAGEYGLQDDQVFVGVGSDDVLAMSFLTFFNSEKPILFPDITYSFYDVWAELFRIPYERPALDEHFHIKKEDYFRENGGIIFPNPNAPTGVSLPLSDIEDIVEHNQDVIVIVDEAYVDFGTQSALPLIEKYENLLVVQTFSKSRSMAGMRIGFALACPKLIKYLNDVKYSFNSYTMNRTSIAAGVAAIKDQEYFLETCGKIIETREWTKKELRKLGFYFEESKANFIEVLVQWFTDNLSQHISRELIIFIISMIPILELRGGLLAASLLKVSAAKAIPICIIGNIIPIPFILLFIRQIFKVLKKTKLFHGLIVKMEDRAMGKSDQIKRYEFFGLLLFVGIPLPGTGAWTGSLIASLLEVDIKKSSIAIFCGLIMATVIMYVVSYGIVGNLIH